MIGGSGGGADSIDRRLIPAQFIHFPQWTLLGRRRSDLRRTAKAWRDESGFDSVYVTDGRPDRYSS